MLVGFMYHSSVLKTSTFFFFFLVNSCETFVHQDLCTQAIGISHLIFVYFMWVLIEEEPTGSII